MGHVGIVWGRAGRVSRIRPITRLRLAFFGLGVALLLPLFVLLDHANDRLQAQRRLRHQVVAERIFDELERELTLLLESESQRPSAAYSLDTSVSAWAPFILGYFTADDQGTRYVAEAQLDPSRRSRLDRALSAWRSGPVGLRGVDQFPQPVDEPDRTMQDSVADEPEAAAAASPPARATPKSSPDVLRQLNRADEQRQRQSVRKTRDPLVDYGY